MSAVADRTAHLARYIPAAAAVGAVVVLYLVFFTGGSSYVLNLRMANADGIRPGSQVTLGGVPVGTVHSLSMAKSGKVVIASLHLQKQGVHLGAGTHDSIIAANLLGEEYVALKTGNPSKPLPSGSTLPESATVAPTDLDQVTDVFNGGTRAELATLLNETGTAVDGRQSDVSALLRQIPLSMTDATALLAQLTESNNALSQAVQRGDEFVSRINQTHRNLGRAVDSVSAAATTLAGRADSLRSTVTGAPEMLETLQSFVTKLGTTATTLKPTAVEISATAPKLNTLLKAVKPFTGAAVPALNEAKNVSPTLTDLAVKATPTLGQSLPTLASLDNIAKLAKPLTGWTALSAPDLFDILSAWPNALQLRDGISHIFNGDLYLNPVIVLDIADQGASASQQRVNFKDILSSNVLQTVLQSGLKVPAGVTATASSGTSTTATTTTTSPSSNPLSSIVSAVTTAVKPPSTTSTTPTSTSTTPSLKSTLSSTGSKTASGLNSLLGYLLGK